ncbi:lysophospholipid acyltransferase family protein [Deinococcus peraridilitoris]|uniref:1-acyl-sn-glycerol-3-phosphate acyltransferase n=1 Tax=Deinococcus peraridilitoris (strain DSM 19664 / LMG 22246 / CIP 109416 / KR-200) TaxID=937777 RepID=L0A300_DEIPD|nr:lysophospholipid acyltransferase family protein [Deinococcus peraridilitoris]AFZ68268.1 1-acyl-sn-glycerol-3-phosphate acyltransferase [Deinococcus peraridilitoris DSM 19664]
MRGRLRHLLLGRTLLWQTAHCLKRLPETLSPAERDAAQKQASARLLRHLRVQLDTTGLEHIMDGPYLVVPLHEGIADVLCLAQLPLPLRFVARDEIFNWPHVGPAIRRLGHVSINPESGARGYRELLRRAEGILKGGESLAMFPQGSLLGIETDFQRGAFVLARQLNVPLLPVVMTGAHRVWEHPFTPRLRYGVRVGMRVLPPTPAPDGHRYTPDELRLTLRQLMKRHALDGSMPAPRRYRPERDGFWDGFRFDIDPDFPELHHQIAERRRSHGPAA